MTGCDLSWYTSMRSLVEVTVGHFKLLGMTEEMFRQMVHDGVDIIRILIENYRNDFNAKFPVIRAT